MQHAQATCTIKLHVTGNMHKQHAKKLTLFCMLHVPVHSFACSMLHVACACHVPCNMHRQYAKKVTLHVCQHAQATCTIKLHVTGNMQKK